MKKTIAIVLSALILLSVVCTAFATNEPNRIYADNVTVEIGKQVTVPVKIENNDGFMGFSISIKYDVDVFTPVSVSKGSMLSGIFNDSIETSTDNSFKVVFTGTDDIVSDGILFNVVFDVSDDASGKYNIELSYSQQDTFDENWKDVSFACEDIGVVVTQNGTTAPTTVTTTTTTTAEPDTEETTTQPSTQKPEETTTKPHTTDPEITDPDVRPKLTSEKIREWADALEAPMSWLFKYPAYFVASIVALFE